MSIPLVRLEPVPTAVGAGLNPSLRRRTTLSLANRILIGQPEGGMSGTKADKTGLEQFALGKEVVGRINELAAISETPEHLARVFLTPEHRCAADLILTWMREAGMSAHLDAIGNVCGRYEGDRPMALRRVALAGAAECISAIEEFCRSDAGGMVGTVGYIQAMPGATNVIPGQVSFTTDIRAPTDTHRKRAVTDIVRRIEAIAKRRDLSLQLDVTHENRTVPCAPWLKARISNPVAAEGFAIFELPSGAGHDGMAMVDIADVAMIFIRCRGGISHHPDEHVELADADAGGRVLLRVIENFKVAE